MCGAGGRNFGGNLGKGRWQRWLLVLHVLLHVLLHTLLPHHPLPPRHLLLCLRGASADTARGVELATSRGVFQNVVGVAYSCEAL